MICSSCGSTVAEIGALIGPTDPDVVASLDEARLILAELGASTILTRVEALHAPVGERAGDAARDGSANVRVKTPLDHADEVSGMRPSR